MPSNAKYYPVMSFAGMNLRLRDAWVDANRYVWNYESDTEINEWVVLTLRVMALIGVGVLIFSAWIMWLIFLMMYYMMFWWFLPAWRGLTHQERRDRVRHEEIVQLLRERPPR